MNDSGNISYGVNQTASTDFRANLVGPEVKSLISDATKRSFLSSQHTDTISSLSSANALEKTDLVCTSSNLSYQPLLPRRHNNEHLHRDEQSSFNKWQPNINNRQNCLSTSSSLTPSSTGTLLSRVAMDDDISELMSRSSLANVAESGDSAWSDFSAIPPNWNFKENVMESNNQHEKDIKNTRVFNGFDPAAQGDTSCTSQSSTTSSLFEKGDTNLLSTCSVVEISRPQTVSSVQSSYVVNEPSFSSLDSARAAGYPVITKSIENAAKKASNPVSEKSFVSASQSQNQKVLQNLPTKLTADDENYIGWVDHHLKYAQNTSSEEHSKVQVTDDFQLLLQQLEILRLESIQHCPISQVDISKAIGLLIKAKKDIFAAKTAGTSLKPGNKQLDDPQSLASSSFGVSGTSDAVPISTSGVVQQQVHASIVSNKTRLSFSSDNINIPHSNAGSASEIAPSFKSPSETRVHFQPPITSTEIKPSVISTRNVNQNSPPAGSNQSSASKQLSKELTSGDDVPSRRSLFPSAESNVQDVSNNEGISYDAFSANVKTSSCHSTPSKSLPSQNVSTTCEKEASLPSNTPNNKSAAGFVILDEKTPPGKLAKKKEQFLRGRLKKEEEQRRHQMERELEAEKRKLEVKMQQEKLIQKKQEEKEKRDKIFQDYQKRKRIEEKAAQRNRGIIGTGSPGNGTKKIVHSKIRSRSMERLNALSNSELGNGTTLTLPVSSRSNYAGSSHRLHVHEEDTDSLGSGGSTEYTGPKLFKQLRSKSNRTLITNAINHCCLSGKVNEKIREKTLNALESSEDRHLMVLFRDNNCQFRALYGYHPDEEKLHRICGNGPTTIIPSMIEALFKYNSGRRSFACVPSKTLSVSIDGITIKNILWQHAKK